MTQFRTDLSIVLAFILVAWVWSLGFAWALSPGMAR